MPSNRLLNYHERLHSVFPYTPTLFRLPISDTLFSPRRCRSNNLREHKRCPNVDLEGADLHIYRM